MYTPRADGDEVEGVGHAVNVVSLQFHPAVGPPPRLVPRPVQRLGHQTLALHPAGRQPCRDKDEAAQCWVLVWNSGGDKGSRRRGRCEHCRTEQSRGNDARFCDILRRGPRFRHKLLIATERLWCKIKDDGRSPTARAQASARLRTWPASASRRKACVASSASGSSVLRRARPASAPAIRSRPPHRGTGQRAVTNHPTFYPPTQRDTEGSTRALPSPADLISRERAGSSRPGTAWGIACAKRRRGPAAAGEIWERLVQVALETSGPKKSAR